MRHDQVVALSEGTGDAFKAGCKLSGLPNSAETLSLSVCESDLVPLIGNRHS